MYLLKRVIFYCIICIYIYYYIYICLWLLIKIPLSQNGHFLIDNSKKKKNESNSHDSSEVTTRSQKKGYLQIIQSSWMTCGVLPFRKAPYIGDELWTIYIDITNFSGALWIYGAYIDIIYILDEPHISIYLLISILILIYGSILIFSLSSKRLDYIDWIRPLICDWKINWESYKFPIQSLDLSKMWK